MKISLIGDEIFTGSGSVGTLYPYINKVTNKSDPFIRLDGRPAALVHLSSIPGRKIENHETREVKRAGAMMDFGVEA